MKIIEGSITAPKGFKAAGVHCGIKKKKKDLAIIYCEVPANAAAVFTSNKVKAASILVSQDAIRKGSKIQAIVANSGSANACTGKKGIEDVKETVEFTAKEFGIQKNSVLVASTGKIGMSLPMDKIKQGIKKVVSMLDSNGSSDAALAILTTDKIKKEIAVEIKIDGVPVRIGGIAKGSGMIYPNMATMLCFLTTDILIDRNALKSALKTSVDSSFNLITVDGDRSTNDMVAVLANGLAGNEKVYRNSSAYRIFQQVLSYVCTFLAKMMVKDAEGATKFIEVKVAGAASFAEAKIAAFSIANSNLVKTAMYGEDPNWGRIVSAVGNAPIKLNPNKIDVFFSGIPVVCNNAPVSGGRERAKRLLSNNEIVIFVDLGIGKGKCSVWTSDLTPGYVKINAAYT
ncbi:bifunctional ornithine acetyltransferase/N-acetylglutamate synthase [Candidatus Desantisbacteria bacterium CG1_02_38_46]|uniref:Arginine biosynthesis bifunctional protein ArgJ n=3 Tax=unclassified Candidatus Desantisiibacteriota TaxID=3106372 RepID=A0A2H9PC88_9BACT|nr:MAG: bifunctional ornithine acetyltransferase/N-acetylglutamate synthase [Candidatus Desantisbacteria bacterium CG1_02_38_46]PIU50859.1 MAG: ornithine acetyltransferase [Candidatus Desantisbacteria bacterium CG07_land_8_20_14_0_80_39_15]PIZ16771.1 MAG: ornithine acetyltransferase [Candidatus Desantisbacteria bacterium CG_4_10_14_0_8_um_filter_39_17]